MPSGTRYRTVVDDGLEVAQEADRFLREIRLARGRAETTTKAYAEAVTLFLRWCAGTGRDWSTAARDMGLFMVWLRWAPGNGGRRQAVVPGPGTPVRGDARINKVLTAVRMFLLHAVVNKVAPAWALEQLYELGDDRDLPVEARGESGGMRYRLRARHRLQEPEAEVDRASDEEVVAMLRVCRSARDRLKRPGHHGLRTGSRRTSGPHLPLPAPRPHRTRPRRRSSPTRRRPDRGRQPSLAAGRPDQRAGAEPAADSPGPGVGEASIREPR